MNCSQSPYYKKLTSCTDRILIDAKLSPAQPYFAVIEDKHDHKTVIGTSADANGVLTVMADEFHPGTFNPYAGFFRLTVLDGNSAPVMMAFGDVLHDSVIFSFELTEAPQSFVGNVIS